MLPDVLTIIFWWALTFIVSTKNNNNKSFQTFFRQFFFYVPQKKEKSNYAFKSSFSFCSCAEKSSQCNCSESLILSSKKIQVKQVWNDIRKSKWCQSFHLWVNRSFFIIQYWSRFGILCTERLLDKLSISVYHYRVRYIQTDRVN